MLNPPRLRTPHARRAAGSSARPTMLELMQRDVKPWMVVLAVIFLCAGSVLAFTHPFDQTVRDGLGFPFLVTAALLGVTDIATQQKPSSLGVTSALVGLFGSFVVGFDGTSEAFRQDWGLGLALFAGGGVPAIGIALVAYVVSRRRNPPAPARGD